MSMHIPSGGHGDVVGRDRRISEVSRSE